MILESIIVVTFALLIDLKFGDPTSKYHPTAWIGNLIAKLTPFARHRVPSVEKVGGIMLVLLTTGIVITFLWILNLGISLITIDWVTLVVSIVVGSILLKTTIAVRGMEEHALAVVSSLESNNLDSARNNLSMIVKRNTSNLDKDHIISGVLESVSENTVDGITGPLFYYALFGLPGAFAYRVVNTADSMVGYRNKIFKNIGWFGAKFDTILNYVPSRLTGFIMIISAALLKKDWKSSYSTMIRDGSKTQSQNAGYPMAALAGALGTKFEKINCYELGIGNVCLTKDHVKSAISIMKVTSFLFFGIVTIPIIVVLSTLGWWIHA